MHLNTGKGLDESTGGNCQGQLQARFVNVITSQAKISQAVNHVQSQHLMTSCTFPARQSKSRRDAMIIVSKESDSDNNCYENPIIVVHENRQACMLCRQHQLAFKYTRIGYLGDNGRNISLTCLAGTLESKIPNQMIQKLQDRTIKLCRSCNSS